MARNRENIIPKHIIDKRKRYERRRIFLITFFVLLVIIGLVMSLRLPILQIKNIEVSGNELIDKEAIIGSVNKILHERYVFVIPKSNLIFVPKHTIERMLRLAYPRILSLDVKERGQTLVVTLAERQGRYLWCGDTVPAIGSDASTCYYMDEKGYIFSRAPYFSLGVYFTFFGGSIENGNPEGQTLLAPEKLMSLLSLREQLIQLDIIPSFTNIVSDTVYEFYLRPVSDSQVTRTRVIARFEDDPAVIVKNLATALSNSGFQSEYKGNEANLLYFDLRFPNKVYYKFNK